ncbi:MAG: SMP-30/gluconolactonase/LRE family protein [Bryobacteraceae bacterium]|nr:SMP-30/gluconolactonase/LRE family protein [Bryobacteraceae bacterium]
MTTPHFVAQPFFTPAAEELRFLPEGPRVLRNQPDMLGWVAIQHAADSPVGSMNLLNLETGVNRSLPLPGRPGFFAETKQPGIVLIGLERRLVLCDLRDGSLTETGIRVTDDERVIINDGLAVDGGVLFGTKHLAFELPIAGLYYFDSASRSVHQVLGGQICSNGKTLMRDAGGATLVDIDSRPKSLARFRLDVALRQVSETRVLVAPERLPGFPDGLRLAPDGKSVVVAFYNPDAVSDGKAQQICLDSGAVLAEWIIPGSPRVTCPEFLMRDGKVKVVFTTAIEGMPPEIRAIAPEAGTMFIADTPFTQCPPPPPLVD